MKLNIALIATILSLLMVNGMFAKTQVTEKIPGVAAQPETYFYTGKPYDADLGAYTFKYRNYDPEMLRWTSQDPSGFPDGANGHIYAAIPTTGIDPLGLWLTGSSYWVGTHTDETDLTAANLAPAYFTAHSYSLSARACSWMEAGTTATIANLAINPTEQHAIEADSAFGLLNSYVKSSLKDNAGGAETFTATADKQLLTFASGDLSKSILHTNFTMSGTITPTWNSGTSMWDYSGELTIAFSDPYDFAVGGGYAVDCFAQLQAHHWSSAFSITGSWIHTFSGSFE